MRLLVPCGLYSSSEEGIEWMGNSMGLILEARGSMPFFFFNLTVL